MARFCSRCISTTGWTMTNRSRRSECKSGTRFRNAEKSFYTKWMILGRKWHLRGRVYKSIQRSLSSTSTSERKGCFKKCKTCWIIQSIWSLMRIWGTTATNSTKLCWGSKAVPSKRRQYSRRLRSTGFCGIWFRKMQTPVESLAWIAQNSSQSSSSFSNARVHWYML